MDLLRDPLWQFIGSVIAIIGVIATVWIYLLQKNRKRLSYEIMASTDLLTTSEEIAGRIEVFFDKQPVQNIHLLVVRFANDGNVAILPSDFYEPIRITFEQETKILGAEVTRRFPESFNPKIMVHEDSQSLEVAPTLINSQDSFRVKILLTQYPVQDLKVSGRVAGVNVITAGIKKAGWERLAELFAFIFWIGIAVIALTPDLATRVVLVRIFAGFFLIGFVTLIIAFRRRKRL